MNERSIMGLIGIFEELGLPPAIRELYLYVIRNLEDKKSELPLCDYLTIADLYRLEKQRGKGIRDSFNWHFLFLLLFFSMNEGSICLSLEDKALEDKIKALLEPARGEETPFLRIETGELRRFVSQEMKTHSILFQNLPIEKTFYDENWDLARAGYVPLYSIETDEGVYLYFHKHLYHWWRLQKKIKELDFVYPAGSEAEPPKELDWLGINEEKKDAVKKVMNNGFVMITGGPGTGKTTAVLGILYSLLKTGEYQISDIRIAAPTGRAAKRMVESIRENLLLNAEKDGPEKKYFLDDPVAGMIRDSIESGELSGETLHRLLRYNPAGNTFLYNSENPLPSRVVIVDEVSMADVEMMNRLLQAMSTGEGSKLVLLGDPDQLPSVQSGAVLSSLVLSGAEREGRMQNHAALKEAFRSGEDILRLASKVNAGEPEEHREALEEILGKNKVPPGQGFDREEGVFRCTPQNQDTSELQALLENWVRVHYRGKYREMVKSIGKECDFGHLSEGDAASLREIFELMEGVQILSLNRKGTFGVEYMNRVCAGIYSGRENGGAIFAGAPIMITANDHYHKLFNGERGIILEDKNGAQYAFFTSLEGFVKFPVHSLPHFELAYAITVHKSQGSGYSKVLMVFPEDRANRLLNRQIFYTGITRAKKYLCIYGKQEILRLAMERKIQRESGPLLIR